MATTLTTRIQLRNDTQANWQLHNPVLLAGELGIENDTGLFKIGNGIAKYNDLPYAGHNPNQITFAADGRSICIDDSGIVGVNNWGKKYYKLVDGQYILQVVDDANPWLEGLEPRVAADECGDLELAWFEPSITPEQLHSTVIEIANTIGITQEKVNSIEKLMLPLTGGTMTGNLILADGFTAASEKMVDEKIEAFASAFTDDGKVNTIMELIAYVEEHGEEVAQMAAGIAQLQDLVGDTSVAAQISSAIAAHETEAKEIFEHKKFEISSTPVGTLVDYKEGEIRVMCPANTEWKHQNVGPTGNANIQYMAFKAYAPANAASFKEGDRGVIVDTMHSFNEAFSGIDQYGRKYSIVWLALASYNDGIWTYYGKNSTTKKYIGWDYVVEWYDADGVKIGNDAVRINLSNEQCHFNPIPYYAMNTIKEVSVNGTILDVINNKVEINTANFIEESEEIGIENNKLTIKKLDASKLTISDDTTLVLNGGTAV